MSSNSFHTLKDTNSVALRGILKEDLEFVAEFHGTRIYKTEIGVFRLSGSEDVLTIFVSDRLENFSSLGKGLCIEIEGSIRTSQYRDHNKVKRTRVYVQVKNILEVSDNLPLSLEENTNEVILEGFLFKNPILRKAKTSNKIDVAELVLVVHRGYNKYEHIPVIVWGTDAKYIAKFPKSTRVSISGRFQSRHFLRHVKGDDDKLESAISYEVSVKSIEVLN